MRKAIFALVIISTILISGSMLCQTTAVPFLLINPSPEANGQGGSSVSRLTKDPYAIISNPAHLGLSSFQTNAAFSFYPTKTNWIPGIGLPITYNSYVVAGGMNLEEYLSAPVAIGIAYSHVYLDLGRFNISSLTGLQVIGTYTEEEHSDALSIGVGVDYYIRLALGITTRRTVSNLDPVISAKARSYDYGLLLDFPITEIVAKDYEILPNITPIFGISFGTALTNAGDRLVYIDIAQADPLPYRASIGTSIELGVSYKPSAQKMVSFIWSRQADDVLIGFDQHGRSVHRNYFGNVDFFKNIVRGERTETVDLSQGWQLGFAEFLFIRGGSFVGTGNRSYKTEGIGLRLLGLFKLVKLSGAEDEILSILTEHFDLRYDQSEYSTTEAGHPLDNTKFSSLSFIIKL